LDESVTAYSGPARGLRALETAWVPDDGNPDERRNFFGFMKYDLGPEQLDLFPESKALIPVNEATRWQGNLIKAVLRNHLKAQSGGEDEVSRVVIYESMANAVQHPKASKIQVASKFYRRERETQDSESVAPEGAFEICVWDDGESMIQTLGNALKKAGKVRLKGYPLSWCDRVYRTIKDETGKKLEPDLVVDQADELPLNATREHILLACFFPGVTRRIADRVHEIPKPRTTAEDTADMSGQLGMGLFTLARTVIDRYGGKLAVRSGDCLLKLKAAHDSIRVSQKSRYIASITRYPSEFPSFKGNLLIMNFPGR